MPTVALITPDGLYAREWSADAAVPAVGDDVYLDASYFRRVIDRRVYATGEVTVVLDLRFRDPDEARLRGFTRRES